MSAPTAIGMVGESLKTLLEEEMTVTPSATVSLLAPDESGTARRINLFLYKVQENGYLKNKDWEVSQDDPTKIVPPPLSLNLHYLLTPYAQNDSETGNTSAHEILGDAMRVLHQFPAIPSEHLAEGLADAREQLKITQVPVDIDELSKVWSTFSTPYRLSVAYEVAVVQLDQSDQSSRDMPPRLSAIGVPSVDAGHALPVVTGISPQSGAAGSVVSVLGENLTNWRSYVDVGRERVADGELITSNGVSFDVPVGLSPGYYRVRINISTLHRSTLYFEVTP
ncbi:DUF4255 domain-containing protein [Teredinibacter purpureus]|uniref:DUF4255 domain-containing protein n=1 Tax=Teredinibacter purpureus TaxID=2731756 RepID=UPI0005F84CD8|nr:DUF4255 domain-containing protein [Teredinibacter purpureus]